MDNDFQTRLANFIIGLHHKEIINFTDLMFFALVLSHNQILNNYLLETKTRMSKCINTKEDNNGIEFIFDDEIDKQFCLSILLYAPSIKHYNGLKSTKYLWGLLCNTENSFVKEKLKLCFNNHISKNASTPNKPHANMLLPEITVGPNSPSIKIHKTMPQIPPISLQREAPVSTSSNIKILDQHYQQVSPVDTFDGADSQDLPKVAQTFRPIVPSVNPNSSSDFTQSPTKISEFCREIRRPVFMDSPMSHYNIDQFINQRINQRVTQTFDFIKDSTPTPIQTQAQTQAQTQPQTQTQTQTQPQTQTQTQTQTQPQIQNQPQNQTQNQTQNCQLPYNHQLHLGQIPNQKPKPTQKPNSNPNPNLNPTATAKPNQKPDLEKNMREFLNKEQNMHAYQSITFENERQTIPTDSNYGEYYFDEGERSYGNDDLCTPLGGDIREFMNNYYHHQINNTDRYDCSTISGTFASEFVDEFLDLKNFGDAYFTGLSNFPDTSILDFTETSNNLLYNFLKGINQRPIIELLYNSSVGDYSSDLSLLLEILINVIKNVVVESLNSKDSIFFTIHDFLEIILMLDITTEVVLVLAKFTDMIKKIKITKPMATIFIDTIIQKIDVEWDYEDEVDYTLSLFNLCFAIIETNKCSHSPSTIKDLTDKLLEYQDHHRDLISLKIIDNTAKPKPNITSGSAEVLNILSGDLDTLSREDLLQIAKQLKDNRSTLLPDTETSRKYNISRFSPISIFKSIINGFC